MSEPALTFSPLTPGSERTSTAAVAKFPLFPFWRETDDAQLEFAPHRLVRRYADYHRLYGAKGARADFGWK